MPDLLDAIKARLAQATPGPWHRTPYSPDKKFYLTTILNEEHWAVADIFDHSDKRGQGNADLIAHVPTDLDYLLARLAQAEAAVKKYGQHLYTCVPVPCVEPGKPHNCSGEPCVCGFQAWQETYDV